MNKRILIVEDESAFALALSSLLKEKGHNVFVAENGREGLEQMRQSLPDLLVTDLRMPVMNGVEMIKAIHRERLARFPILVITTSPDMLKKGRIKGVEVIQKPLEFVQAIDAIERMLEKKL